MGREERIGEVAVVVHEDARVATVEMCRPPNNFFNVALIRGVASAYERLDDDDDVRVIVLCSEGKHFSAGADFSRRDRTPEESADEGNLYHEALRLFRADKPVVAAVQGAAVGGGLGLACSADFRVAAPESRFTANFAQLGFHHGFGLSVTLPQIVGHQHALDLLYRGRRIGGEEAQRFGLCDALVPADELRAGAIAFAADIATSGPLALEAIRRTMRGDLGDRVEAALAVEQREQTRLGATEDFQEGVRATAERRPANFRRR
jgi:enoyl-CoA hydratase/carnithine racemase